MKFNKPILIPIPKYLAKEIVEYVDWNYWEFNYDIQYFYYIINYIANAYSLRRKEEKEGFIPINIKKLQEVTVSNIRTYIKVLENGEFIISDNEFIPGRKSKGYKINPRFLKGEYLFYEVKPGSKLFSKLKRRWRNNKAHYDRLPPYLKQMKDLLMKVELDYPKAEQWINNVQDENKKLQYLSSLYRMKDHRSRYFKRNKTNERLDTNLTNFKSDMRQYIIGYYVSIDLKNSQPTLLSQLLKHIIERDRKEKGSLCFNMRFLDPSLFFGLRSFAAVSKIHQTSKNAFLVNLNSFEQSVLQGTFYEDFLNRFSGNISRDEVKEILLKVLFSRNVAYREYRPFVSYKKEKAVFSSVYPYVYKCVYALKQKDHSKLAIYLQRLESYIFIDCIAKELVESGIVPLTIHDSVLVDSHYKDRAMEIIKNTFLKQLGVVPSFRIKALKQGTNESLNRNNTTIINRDKNKYLNLDPYDSICNSLIDLVHPDSRRSLSEITFNE